MTWFSAVGLISTITLFLPIIIIFSVRLAWYKSMPALLVYYIFVATHNLLSLDFISVDKDFIRQLGVLNNLLDAPLMLSFLTYFSRTPLFKKRMKFVIAALVLFDLILILAMGFNIDAAIIAMAPGLSTVLAFSILFFIHQAKITVVYQKAAGKAFIAASLLFAYGGYSFIYVVYYLMKTPHIADTHIVYFLINIFSCLLIAVGLFMERKRVKQLNELKVARQELRIIYGKA